MTDIDKCREIADDEEIENLYGVDDVECKFCHRTYDLLPQELDEGKRVCIDCYRKIVVQNAIDGLEALDIVLKKAKSLEEEETIRYAKLILETIIRIE